MHQRSIIGFLQRATIRFFSSASNFVSRGTMKSVFIECIYTVYSSGVIGR